MKIASKLKVFFFVCEGDSYLIVSDSDIRDNADVLLSDIGSILPFEQ